MKIEKMSSAAVESDETHLRKNHPETAIKTWLPFNDIITGHENYKNIPRYLRKAFERNMWLLNLVHSAFDKLLQTSKKLIEDKKEPKDKK